MSMTVGVLYCAGRIGILLRYRSVFIFCLLSRDKGKEYNGGKKEHTCDTGGKKLIAKKFGAGLVANKKKAEKSPVV